MPEFAWDGRFAPEGGDFDPLEFLWVLREQARGLLKFAHNENLISLLKPHSCIVEARNGSVLNVITL